MNNITAGVLNNPEIVDKRGTGILRMNSSMEKWGLPHPTFREDSGYFVIKFTGPYQGTIIKIPEELNERQKKAVEYLKEKKEITRKDYEKLNNISKRTAIRDLNNLIARGILKTSGTTDDKKYLISE